jgi:hypothetical protein
VGGREVYLLTLHPIGTYDSRRTPKRTGASFKVHIKLFKRVRSVEEKRLTSSSQC